MRCRAAWTSARVTIVVGIPSIGAGGKRDALALLQPTRELHAVTDAELVEDRLEVALHGLRRDPEPLGHLARPQAVGHEQGDLALALREPVRGGGRDSAVDAGGGHDVLRPALS